MQKKKSKLPEVKGSKW